MRIRRIELRDIEDTAQVHEAVFPRQLLSKEWIACNVQAYPRMFYFIAENDNGQIVGFIHWTQKSGFRQHVILELEQIGVCQDCRGRGLGSRLISETLAHVQATLELRQASIKHVMVTTRADNSAQRLYRKVLGAEIEATLTDLYSADEVVMIARNVRIIPFSGVLIEK
jgi:ribosomal protein S18 acetylase RimI-like enzyme